MHGHKTQLLMLCFSILLFFFFFFYPVTKPFCFFLVFRRHTCCIKHCLFFIKWAAAKCKTQTSLSCLLKLIVAAQGKVSGSRRGLVTSPQFSAECGSSPSFFFLVLDAAAVAGGLFSFLTSSFNWWFYLDSLLLGLVKFTLLGGGGSYMAVFKYLQFCDQF